MLPHARRQCFLFEDTHARALSRALSLSLSMRGDCASIAFLSFPFLPFLSFLMSSGGVTVGTENIECVERRRPSPLHVLLTISAQMWAVAAVAIVDAAGSPLLLRTYTSPPQVLQSPEAPQQAHLYVGPEDIVKLHFLLFASLDRCNELWQASKQQLQSAAAAAASKGVRGSGAAVKQQQPMHRSSSATPAAGDVTTAGNSSTGSAVRAAAAASTTQGHVRPSSQTSAVASANASITSASAAPPPPPPSQRLVTSATDVRFTGKLIQSHRFLSYGFCSATGIKTLLVTVGCEAPQDAVLPLCRAIYEAASAALCNPFCVSSLSVRVQEALSAKHYREYVAFRERRERQEGEEEEEEEEGQDGTTKDGWTAANAHTVSFGGAPGSYEHRWPTAAAAAAAAASSPYRTGQQPTLALSETFNTQLKAILSTFTVTAQSHIIH